MLIRGLGLRKYEPYGFSQHSACQSRLMTLAIVSNTGDGNYRHMVLTAQRKGPGVTVMPCQDTQDIGSGQEG